MLRRFPKSPFTVSFPPTHPALASALAARDYSVPTPVQVAVVEAGAASQDLLVSARTGSGKTVAFGLAMARTILGEAERFDADSRQPLALIIAPTRELALQVQRELDWLYAGTAARIATCVGGMDPRAEVRALNQGAHIVVGTPGRLRDHLERKRLDLSALRTVVLDEADEMLDLGFREDLEFILDATPGTRQTLLFSATMPRAIVTLARRYQSEAVRIEVKGSEEQHSDIEYHAVRVTPGDVEKAVVNVLRFHEARAALVFCATREGVKRMHARLLERGFQAVALSGELTQNERTHALEALREGRARVLVATDVAARGLDLPDLALVIHADLPNDPETLLHRSGRTGRAGRKGICMLVVPYTRRRKAEALLFAAKLRVRWGAAPTPDEIRARDSERFLADPAFSEAASEAEMAEVASLQAAQSADAITLALVRMRRTQLPEAEGLAPDAGPPRRTDRVTPDRSNRDRPAPSRPDRPSFRVEGDRAGADAPAPRAPRPPRPSNAPMSWFRLNIGRAQNADPRWLLPLICRAGNVTKTEIGAIKIFENETRFEIAAQAADAFADAARTAKKKEGHISRVGADAPEDLIAVNESIAAIDNAPRRPPSERPKRKGAHTSLPLAERLAAAASERPKARWKDRKPVAQQNAGPPPTHAHAVEQDVRPVGSPADGQVQSQDQDLARRRPSAPFRTGAKNKFFAKKKARPATVQSR